MRKGAVAGLLIAILVAVAGCGDEGVSSRPESVDTGLSGSGALARRSQAPPSVSAPPAPEPTLAVTPPIPASGDLVIFDLNGQFYAGTTSAEPRLLGNPKVGKMRLSADGEWMLQRRSPAVRDPYWLVPTRGGVEKQVKVHLPTDVVWRKKAGDMVVAEDRTEGSCTLFTLSLSSGATREYGTFACNLLDVSPDERYALTVSVQDFRSVQVVDLQTGSIVTTSHKPEPGQFVRWIPDGRLLLHYRGSIGIADRDGNMSGSLSADESGLLFQGVTVDPSGRWAAASYGMGEKTVGIGLYDLTTFKKMRDLPINRDHSVYGWSPDSRFFATGPTSGGDVTVWDTQSWTAVNMGSFLKGKYDEGEWSATGHRLLLRNLGDSTVVIADIDARAITPIKGSRGAISSTWASPPR